MAEHEITSSDLGVRERVCMCLHTLVFVCAFRGVTLDGFMICKDVCHIGSGGKQYPLL